ncbi:MAG TPA: CoA transferase [Acidimicrobiales bacterium]|nr:CoA transferase [Acidimicrobiales bacterium]
MTGTGGSALQGIRVCDLTGQLAGAGATRLLAALGAEVVRVEDPVRQGRWDILRGAPPFVDDRRGIELGGGFNNHNVGKLGVTINLRDARGRRLFEELVAVSDAVTENFAAGVMERMGLGYERLKELRPDIIYVSQSGFGQSGPYRDFKTWGPIVQALCGLTATSGLEGMPPAGWGYSFMDHGGAYVMALAVLAALVYRDRTGCGQWVDLSTVEAGASLAGLALLDASVNGAPYAVGAASSNRDPGMAPHGIYPARGDDRWVAIACRSDAEWQVLGGVIGEVWAHRPEWRDLAGRKAAEDELDRRMAEWTAHHDEHALAGTVRAAGVPAAAVLRPEERIDGPAGGREPGAWLWPEVRHAEMGRVRVDGLPLHLSRTPWAITRAAPCLGADNDRVLGELLGHDADELRALRADGVIS